MAKNDHFLQLKNSAIFGRFSTCIIKTSILSIALCVQLASHVMHLIINFYSKTYKFSLVHLKYRDVTFASRIRIYPSYIKITSNFSRCTREHRTTNLLFRLVIEKLFHIYICTSFYLYVRITLSCGYGGIGRHAVLRGQRAVCSCRFKSCYPHVLFVY